MAKPRVFVSSTYYDLKHIRNGLEEFIESFGFEPVLFESGDIPFLPESQLDESCYAELKSCDMFILLIGGRYGSQISGEVQLSPEEIKKYERYTSITKKEYQEAREKRVPLFVFVEKGVYAEHRTYKVNKAVKDLKFAHVDHIAVYEFIDEIFAKTPKTFLKDFERITDITDWLRDQWAGLFADFLRKRKEEQTLKQLHDQIADLSSTSAALKKYAESLIENLTPKAKIVIEEENRRLHEADRLKIFSSNRLINYIERKTAFSSPEIWDRFQTTSSMNEFLTSLGLEPDSPLFHATKAKEDYEDLLPLKKS